MMKAANQSNGFHLLIGISSTSFQKAMAKKTARKIVQNIRSLQAFQDVTPQSNNMQRVIVRKAAKTHIGNENCGTFDTPLEQSREGKAMGSTRRIIRKAMVEVIESKKATPGVLLKACRLLLKISLAPKGKPRGRGFKKADVLPEKPQDRLNRILSEGKPN